MSVYRSSYDGSPKPPVGVRIFVFDGLGGPSYLLNLTTKQFQSTSYEVASNRFHSTGSRSLIGPMCPGGHPASSVIQARLVWVLLPLEYRRRPFHQKRTSPQHSFRKGETRCIFSRCTYS